MTNALVGLVAGAALHGFHAAGGLRAVDGGLLDLRQGLRCALAGLDGGLVGLHRRIQRVDHGLHAGLRLAAGHHVADHGLQRVAQAAIGQLRLAGAAAGRRHVCAAVEDAGGAADLAHHQHADLLEHVADGHGAHLVAGGNQVLKAHVDVGPVVAVAGGCVQGGDIVAVLVDLLGGDVDVVDVVLRAQVEGRAVLVAAGRCGLHGRIVILRGMRGSFHGLRCGGLAAGNRTGNLEGGGLAGIVQAGLQLVVQLEQRHGCASHLQGGHVVAHEGLVGLDALGFEDLLNFVVEDVELHQRSAAQAVDHHGDLAALEDIGVGEDLAQELTRDVLRRGDGLAVDAGFAVDAHADLDFVLGEGEAGLAHARQDAGGHGHAHGAHVGDGLFGHGLDLGQALAHLGGCTRDLVHKHGARDAAATGGIGAVLHGHVVLDHHVIGLDAVQGGHLAGHGEVHDVAGVVLDNHQHACAGVRRLDSLHDAVRGRGGEHVAGHRCVQHALAHVARVRRLMAAAAAGDQADLALLLLPAGDDLNALAQVDHCGVRLGQALQHLADHIVGIVDNLLHACFSFEYC